MRVTMRDATAYSTSFARRLVANFPPPARIPLTPSWSSLSQTLASLRLNFVNDQPSRAAACADVGIALAPVPSRRRISSASTTINNF